MAMRILFAGALAALSLTACQAGAKKAEKAVVSELSGGVNPYLWRASLDTLQDLPLRSGDPIGGVIIYDWASFASVPGERMKANVYILDTRLRADGVKVTVFRQVNQGGQWVDAAVDPETGIQLENAILNKARNLKAAEIS